MSYHIWNFVSLPYFSDLMPTSSSSSSYSSAKSLQEACAIAQELLKCGLLVPVASGYDGDDNYNYNNNTNEDDNRSISTTVHNDPSAGMYGSEVTHNGNSINSSGNSGNSGSSSGNGNSMGLQQQVIPNFYYSYGYIYRFGEKAGSMQLGGSRIECTVFGALCQVEILEWSHSEVDDLGGGGGGEMGGGGGRESLYVVSSNGKEATKGHIEYLVNVSHGGDNWKIWKRYREFEQLNKALLREGIKVDVSLPSKTFSSALGRSISQTYLENRKIGLEKFLECALDAVIGSGNANAMVFAAAFLDEDHAKLRM